MLVAAIRGTPAVRSSSARGSGDWWNDVEITAASGRAAWTRSVRRARSAASTGGGSPRIHGQAQGQTSSTPGNSAAASAPAGPARKTTRPAPPRATPPPPGSATEPPRSGPRRDRPPQGSLEQHVPRVFDSRDQDGSSHYH